MIGTHTVTLYPDPASSAGAVDISCLVDTVSIHHGRDDTSSQPEASSATLELSLDTGDVAFPAILEIGAALDVATVIAGTSYPRFRGRVTDIALGWEEDGAQTPDRLIGQLTAIGALSELGRRVIGTAPFPAQLDGARVSAALSAAGVTLNPATSDPGTVQIRPRDVDSANALEVAQAAAISAGGTLWQTKAGEIRYADASHRRGTPAAVSLDACDVLVTPTWRRTTEGLINKVSIGYGVAPEGGEQPRFVAQRDDSIARYGRAELTTETELNAAGDAAAMGNLLLTRNRTPVWIMSALPIALSDLDQTRTAAALGMDMHDLLNLTGLPAAGTAPTSAALWIEGWNETLEHGIHELELLVSGYCRTVPAPQWDEIDPAMTWNTVPAGMTWDDATCLGPIPSAGRWSDVPASLRWDQIAPAITWDTWPY